MGMSFRPKLGGPLAVWALARCFPLRSKAKSEPTFTSNPYGKRLCALLDIGCDQPLENLEVLDYGCGSGSGVIALARLGAKKVVGLDIREEVLISGREEITKAGLSERCMLTTHAPDHPVDVIVSMDSFEHFADPSYELVRMAQLLKPEGCIIASFGPTWLHPRGGHLFSVFPWAHLLFSEAALCRWRSQFRADGANQFCEVEGGLNQITIAKFLKMVASSPFELSYLKLHPIGPLRLFHNRWTREWFTSVVDCVLVPRQEPKR